MATAATHLCEVIDDFGNVPGEGVGTIDGLKKQTVDIHDGMGRARGLHDPNAAYCAMDVVAFNGSEWRAVRDDPGPLPGDGWVLGAKGSRGKPGERGPPGVHVKTINVVGYCLVIELSDGRTMRANLLPVLELFEREKGAA
jgi:integrin beta 3